MSRDLRPADFQQGPQVANIIADIVSLWVPDSGTSTIAGLLYSSAQDVQDVPPAVWLLSASTLVRILVGELAQRSGATPEEVLFELRVQVEKEFRDVPSA